MISETRILQWNRDRTLPKFPVIKQSKIKEERGDYNLQIGER